MFVSTDKVYVVKVSDDVTVKVVWDGCVRSDPSSGWEFLMTDEDGVQVAVPAYVLGSATVEVRVDVGASGVIRNIHFAV